MQKQARSGRASAEQYIRMLDFFASTKGLAEGKFTAIHGRQESLKKWEELANLLNGLNGAVKSAAQWQIVSYNKFLY